MTATYGSARCASLCIASPQRTPIGLKGVRVLAGVALFGALSLLGFGCAPLASRSPSVEFRVLSYNVKSLFDAEDSGREYPEFSVAEGRWDEARYRRRLELLAEVVRAAQPERKGPDILCLVELENRRVLDDLCRGPLAESGYRYLALEEATGEAVHCGIASRWPIRSLRTHALAGSRMVKGGRGAAVGAAGGAETLPNYGRLLLEADIEVGSGREARAGGTALRLFVCHWKSKLGGAEATEAARCEAAAHLASRVAAVLAENPGAELLVCGDFNESPDEYARVGRRYPTALFPANEAEVLAAEAPALLVASGAETAGLHGGRVALYSPWIETEGYSYIYEGAPERIDGFLLAPGLLDGRGLRLSGFYPLDESFLLDGKGAPRAWSGSSRSGYSDHLPVVLELAYGEAGF